MLDEGKTTPQVAKFVGLNLRTIQTIRKAHVDAKEA